MKKFLTVLMIAALALVCLFGMAGCGDNTDGGTGEGEVNKVITDRTSINNAYNGIYNKGEINDAASGFGNVDAVKTASVYVNGKYQSSFGEFNSRNDVKLEFYGEDATRLVCPSNSYAFTLPTTEVEADYSISKYRTQYTFGSSILSVSNESSNPYTANLNPWYTYCSEWVIRHINNDALFSNNNLTRLNGTKAYEFTERDNHGDLDIKKGYDVYRYDVLIDGDDDGQIDRPYYNIAIIRPVTSVTNFVLMVMKSSEDCADIMNDIVDSYTHLTPKGLPRNYFDAGVAKEDPNWDDATKAYFKKLTTTDYTGWGAFTYSMPGDENGVNPETESYKVNLERSQEAQKGIEEIWGHKFDIYPTYTHLIHEFPLAMAKELAGGDGVNGKPILQFTYQFTTNNNIVAANLSPMFDIMRGKYDDKFRKLAADVKAYGAPMLFRLNNEMNTDWTSYCGILNLFDPDIFNMTWRRLYDIFTEEKVTNVIWIWNPAGTSCPYSSWGEDLCYFPGLDYVQILGGTCYEMNNYSAETASTEIQSFKNLYRKLYQKNSPVFSKWYMIISEFACGSGGDVSGVLGRNVKQQAEWIDDMFDAFNADEREEWVKTIKGAIWFNQNDYSGAQITNRLCFFKPAGDSLDAGKYTYDDLQLTYDAFKRGFAGTKNRA